MVSIDLGNWAGNINFYMKRRATIVVMYFLLMLRLLRP